MSTTAARAEPPRASLAQSALSLPSRAVAWFSGPVGLALKILLLGTDERDRGLGRDHPRRRGALAGGRRARADHDRARRRLRLAAAVVAAAEVPDPRDAADAGVPGDPDPLHGQRRVHELLDRPHPRERGGDRGDPAQLARAARERQVVPDGAGAGRRRQPRPAAGRRGDRRGVRGHARGAHAGRARLDPDRRARDLRGRGVHDRDRPGARHARPRADRVHRADRRLGRDPPRGARRRQRARAHAPLRRGERPLRPHLGRRRVHGRRARARSEPRAARSSSRAGSRTSASRTSRRSSTTRSSATPSCGSSSGRSRSRSSASCSRSCSASRSRSRSTSRCASSARTARS